MTEDLSLAKEAFANAGALLVTAGPGMGHDSGLPDLSYTKNFRNAYPAIAKLDISYSEMANPYWFQKMPRLAWAYHGHRLSVYRNTLPHSAYAQLLQAGQAKPGGYFVYTSNVDGQFQKAGFADDRIVECNGSVHYWQCTAPCCDTIWEAPSANIAISGESFEAQGDLPTCAACGALARPNMLMAGDWAWLHQRLQEQSRRMENWLRERFLQQQKIVIVEMGTGLAEPTVRLKSERLAKTYRATLIRISPHEPDPYGFGYGLATGAAQGVAQLVG